MNWFNEYSRMNNSNLCNMPCEDAMHAGQTMDGQMMDGASSMPMDGQMMWGSNPMPMPGQMMWVTNPMTMPGQTMGGSDPMPGQMMGGFNPFFNPFGFFPFGFFFLFPHHHHRDFDENREQYGSNVYPYISPLF